jgi:hypothetical protein
MSRMHTAYARNLFASLCEWNGARTTKQKWLIDEYDLSIEIEYCRTAALGCFGLRCRRSRLSLQLESCGRSRQDTCRERIYTTVQPSRFLIRFSGTPITLLTAYALHALAAANRFLRLSRYHPPRWWCTALLFMPNTRATSQDH